MKRKLAEVVFTVIVLPLGYGLAMIWLAVFSIASLIDGD